MLISCNTSATADSPSVHLTPKPVLSTFLLTESTFVSTSLTASDVASGSTAKKTSETSAPGSVST